MMNESQERREVRYRGHVQGVGFRYTTAEIARRFAVTGYVKNLADGRVELVAEGDSAEVAAFLDAVAEAMGGHIREALHDRLAPSGEFADFRIRH